MTRLPLWWAAAVIVTIAGVAGLARGATPQSSGTGGGTSNSPPIVVTGAYVRQPASPDVAAAYFTVYNTTAVPDTLISVITGAGGQASLMTDATNGTMVDTPNVVIPAHGNVSFKPTTAHVMIEQLYGPITAGQSVDIQLAFANAGQVIVVAPVIGIYDPAPTGAAATTTATSTASPSTTASVSPSPTPTAGATS